MSATDPYWRQKGLCGLTRGSWETPSARPQPVDRDRLVTQARAAISICDRCPVKAECHDFAQKHPPIGQIQAGIPYDDQRRAAALCQNPGCRRPIVCRGVNAAYCRDACQAAMAARRSQGRERVAA